MNVVDAKSAVQGMVDTLLRESRGKRQRLAKIPGWRSLPFFCRKCLGEQPKAAKHIDNVSQ